MNELIEIEKLVPRSVKKENLFDYSLSDFELWLEEHGESKFRGKQVFKWMYHKELDNFEDMTDLSKKLRQKLQEHFFISHMMPIKEEKSTDGTRKYLFELDDKRYIEAVLIPEQKRNTLCISSQVGCALGCKFCYTATMGAGRNLRVSEFIGQFFGVKKSIPAEQEITNVVFMGMGEPLVNFKNLIKVLDILMNDYCFGLGARRVTVSTAGLCPQILEMKKHSNARLAISLHATTDALRDQIMPINQRYNLDTLFNTLREFQEGRKDVITIEYTLMKDLNDHLEDAHRLVKLSRSIRAKVNLIPYNEHPGAPYKTPTKETIQAFRQVLHKARVVTTVRSTRGDDISAACGQLALESVG